MSMSELTEKRFNVKEKRVVAAAFTALFASSEQSPFRKAQDLATVRTRDQQLLAQGLGQGQSHSSAKASRKSLFENFQNVYLEWLIRRGFHTCSMILFHDDFMKYEKKHSFTLSTSAEVNPATDAKKVMGKTYLVQVFAVGGFKILENAPIVYTDPEKPIQNPDYISTHEVVEFCRNVYFKNGATSCKSPLRRFLDGDFTKGELPDMKKLLAPGPFFEMLVNHFYRLISDDRNSKLAGMNHLQDSSFKSFVEILQSLLAFIANPLIFKACEEGRYFLLGADWPGWNMSLVLILQGEGKGRRTWEHLGELIKFSMTPLLQQQFEMLLKEDRELQPQEQDVESMHRGGGDPPSKKIRVEDDIELTKPLPYARLAKVLQQIVPVTGNFHIKLNDIEDAVGFFDEMYTKLYAFIVGTKKGYQGTKHSAVADMKARMKICLLNAFVSGMILVLPEITLIFDNIVYADNLALAILRYYCEWVAPEGMLFYDMIYKNGKYPDETQEIIALLLADRVKTQRHNYDKLLSEKLSTELYWIKIGHPMAAFMRAHGHKVDEITMEGTIIKIIDKTTAGIFDPDLVVRKATLHWAKKYSLVVETLKSSFQVIRDKLRNPLGVSSDKLALIASEFILKTVSECIIEGGSYTFSMSRKKNIVTDTVIVPVLFGSNKKEACRVLPPGWALFPDLKTVFPEANRQASDRVDGFCNPNGCQYRNCKDINCAAKNSEVQLVLMLCNHVVCTFCTESNGFCKKCVEKELEIIEYKSRRKAIVRKDRYLTPSIADMHLTREPGDESEQTSLGVNEDEPVDADEPLPRSRDSESEDDDQDNEIICVSEKEKMITNLKENFRRSQLSWTSPITRPVRSSRPSSFPSSQSE